jgi:site-specific DNA-methyltransferase (adenine-specific)
MGDVGIQGGNFSNKTQRGVIELKDAPATPQAQKWAGWGTALKPALEPITMARKPLTGTVAANVLEHGTGAINVDGCRVAGPGAMKWETPRGGIWATDSTATAALVPNEQGRWPANLIHDGSDEVVGLFPETTSGKPCGKRGASSHNVAYADIAVGSDLTGFGDSGSAARFFYCAKADSSERQGVTHPTVKPLDLMAYLCRLVTPPGGTVLDPFMGSGTTIKAAIGEGFQAIGIERDPAYFAMAEHRMHGAQLGLPFS